MYTVTYTPDNAIRIIERNKTVSTIDGEKDVARFETLLVAREFAENILLIRWVLDNEKSENFNEYKAKRLIEVVS